MAACSRCAATRSTRRRLPSHAIPPIDLLVVNLYPFEATVAGRRGFRRLHREYRYRRAGPDPRRRRRIMQASPWWSSRPIMCAVLAAMAETDGGTTLDLRKRLAAKAFSRTSAYDAAIASWFASELGEQAPPTRVIAGTNGRDAPLWREPPSMGGLLPDGGAALRRRDRAPGAREGALLQQSERHRRGL